MAEIYKDKVYDAYIPQKKEGTLAIDIGANLGLVTYFLSQRFEKVISVEPSTEHFDLLSKMCLMNELDNVLLVKRAIFIKNGNFAFGGPDNNKTMRSLHMATWQDQKPLETVQAITMDQLFEENKIEHCDLLKLDIEGSEVEVFSSGGFAKVAPKIDTIVAETHAWNGRHPNQIKDALKNNGFEVKKIENDASLFVAVRK